MQEMDVDKQAEAELQTGQSELKFTFKEFACSYNTFTADIKSSCDYAVHVLCKFQTQACGSTQLFLTKSMCLFCLSWCTGLSEQAMPHCSIERSPENTDLFQ